MKPFDSLVHTPFAAALGWALFHSLWEGGIVAAVLAMALRVARSSRTRYLCAGVAMIAILAAAVITLFRIIPGPAHRFTTPHSIPAPALAVDLTPAAVSTQSRIAEIVPWLTPLWLLGVIAFYLRGAASWAAARRLRGTGVCVAPEAWQQRLRQLGEHLRVTAAVSLLESSIAKAPVVIGFLRPVILTPVGMLAGMPVSQIESILLHELAHIRRADYLANLLQTAAEGLLFYHPAVWWISHVIRVERENCCDDLAVSANGNAHEYATALSALAENRLAVTALPANALSANGGALMKRIRRLLYPETTSPSLVMPLLLAGAFAIVTAWAAIAWQATPALPPAPKQLPHPSLAQTEALPPAGGSLKRSLDGQATFFQGTQVQRAVPAQAASAATDPFPRWLNEDVAYVITNEERNAFLSLNTNAEREKFIEQFWLRRDPTPGTIVNEYKEEHYRRIAYANVHFTEPSGVPGWKTDRGRIYITFGTPDEIDAHPDGLDSKPPFENWRYRFLEGIGDNVIMEFVDVARRGEYRMTMDPNPPQ